MKPRVSFLSARLTPRQARMMRVLEFLVRVAMRTRQPLHRTACLQRIGGFREDLVNYEEYEMHFRLALAGARFKKIDSVLALYRMHEGKDRVSKRPYHFSKGLEARYAMYEQAARAGVLDERMSCAFAAQFAAFGRMAYREGRRECGIRAYRFARRMMRLPRTHNGLPYDVLSIILGFELTEKLYVRVRGEKSR